MIHKLLKARLLAPTFIMVLAIVAAACGSDTPTEKPTQAPQPQASTSTPVPKAKATATPAPAPAVTPAAAAPAAPKVETLVIAVDPAAGECNVPWGCNVDAQQQFDPVMEVLADIDPHTNKWVPELAKSWEMSADGTEWTFVLEEGVPWHTGKNGEDWGTFTADDALHGAAMLGRDDSMMSWAANWRSIQQDQSTIVNDHEVIFKLDGPNPDYMFYIATSGGGVMTSKAQWDAGGDDLAKEDMIGTGPYRFVDREWGVNVEYELLPDHWRRNDPPPDFQKIELRWIKEVATRNAGLLAGEIHMTELTRDLADGAVANNGMKIIASIWPGNQIIGVFGGLVTPGDHVYEPEWRYPDLQYTDIRVREAMARAIDRQQIADTLFAGRVTQSAPLGFYPNLPGWDQRWLDDAEQDYGYDPAKARELLADAGYEPGDVQVTGALINMFGFSEAPDMMQAIGVMFEAVGISMVFEEWEWVNFRATWHGREPGANMVWLVPPSYKTVFAQLQHFFWTDPGHVPVYEDEWLDNRLDDLMAAVDPDERDTIQRDMGNYINDIYAEIPLFYIFIEWTVNPNIVDQWPFPGSDGANYGHWDMITACTTPEPCMD